MAQSESQKFDATMKKVLSVSKVELQKRLEAEKKAKPPKTIDKKSL
jgi:hypothetical protein